MVAIRVLPPEVINRIAAGEVIERPASVVKELVENAIDAGARRVAIDLEEGGRKTIRIRDDGAGIAPDDLPLAFAPHATSKLRWERGAQRDVGGIDLLDVATLGFRGEALASIASIAEVEMLTRTGDSDCGVRFRPADAQDAAAPEPVAAPRGTTVEVRNLFFNTPARRKFLKTVATEQSHAIETVTRLALSHPEVAFRLRHGKRTIFDLRGGVSLRQRVADVVGEDRSTDLLPVCAVTDGPGGIGVTSQPPWLEGFVLHPRQYRADTKSQHFFVNGRWVRDRTLLHALREAFQGYQISGRHPLAFIYLRLPHDQVDINVHPQKHEVRFLDSGALHRGVFHAVRTALKDVGERPQAPQPVAGPAVGTSAAPVSPAQSASASGPARGASPPRAPTGAGRPRSDRFEEAAIDAFHRPAKRAGALPQERGERRATRPPVSERPPAGQSPQPSQLELGGGERSERLEGRRAFQVLDSFIATERDGSLVLFDQHALHEKVLYERILEGLSRGDIAAQRLLLPEVIRLDDEHVPQIEVLLEELRRFGFEVEPFGEREVAVQAVPRILDRAPVTDIVLAVAAWLRDHPAGARAAADGVVDESRRRLAALMACKRAVRAGDSLHADEIDSLLAEGARALDPGYCPHGRRAAVVLTRAELERLFDRK